MTAPLILGCLPNLAAAATLTAGSEGAGTPAAHLLTDEPGKVWRSTTTNPFGTGIGIDFGSTVIIGAVVITGCNARSSATWSVYGDDSGPIPQAGPLAALRILDQPLHTSTAWAPDRDGVTAVITLDTPAAYRYWRVEVADFGHPAGYIEASFLGMGPAVQVELDTAGATLGEGFSIEVVDPSVRARYGGGHLYESPRRRFLRATLPLVAQSAVGTRDLFGLMRTGGRMAVSLLPDISGVPPLSLWASIVAQSPLQHRTGLLPGDSAALYWSTVLTLEEV